MGRRDPVIRIAVASFFETPRPKSANLPAIYASLIPRAAHALRRAGKRHAGLLDKFAPFIGSDEIGALHVVRRPQ